MKFKNQKLYKALKIIVFFLIVFLCVGITSKVTQRKDSIRKHQNFVELSEQIDVLLLGSSHIRNAINPIQLYAEHGITSYNMSKSTAMITESYWTLVNALDYCNPKCIVIDIWSLDKNYKYLDIMNGDEPQQEKDNLISYLHEEIDYLPLSKNKIATINDLISDSEIKKEFFWDFILYHGRWSELGKEDFEILFAKVEKNELMGALSDTGHMADMELFQVENIGEVVSQDTVSLQYLYKILDLCEERGIEVVMTFLPMGVSYEKDWQAVNTAKKVAEERGIAFIDMLTHETQAVVDYYTDFYDESHVNSNGMRKITSYIGRFLAENLALEDHRNDPAYETWAQKVDMWQSGEIQILLSEQNLYQKLGQIQNVNASTVIFMPGGSQALQDPLVRRFIKQLTGTTVVDDAAKVVGPYLLMRDTVGAEGSKLRNTEFAGEAQPEVFQTILGETTYLGLNNFAAIYINGDMEKNYLDMEKYYSSEVQILILGQDGEVMKHFIYDPDWDNLKIKE